MNTKRYLREDILLFLYLFFAISLNFFLLAQKDLFHTAISSNTFHLQEILKFYSYNKGYVGANDYFPILYIIFSIWNFFLQIFGINLTYVSDPNLIEKITFNNLPFYEVYWWKLLVVFFYIGGLRVLNKLVKDKNLYLILLCSPLLILLVFGFGFYDSIIFFAIALALLAISRSKNLLFTLILGIAFPIKFFSIFIFIPIILIYEKKFLKLVLHCFIFFLPLFFIIFIFRNDPNFINQVFVLAHNKLLINYDFQSILKLISFLLYIFFCYISYFKLTNKLDKNNLFLITYIALMPIFFAFKWHPQWLIIIYPFYLLILFRYTSKLYFILIEFIFFFLILFLLFYVWPNNIDSNTFLFSKHLNEQSLNTISSLFNLNPYLRLISESNTHLYIFVILNFVLALPLFLFLFNYSKEPITTYLAGNKINGISFIRPLLSLFFIFLIFCTNLNLFRSDNNYYEFIFSFNRDHSLTLGNDVSLITQKFSCPMDNLKGLSFLTNYESDLKEKSINISLYHINEFDQIEDEPLYAKNINYIEKGFSNLIFDNPVIDCKNKKMQININSHSGDSGIVFYFEDKINRLYVKNQYSAFINNKSTDYVLVFKGLY